MYDELWIDLFSACFLKLLMLSSDNMNGNKAILKHNQYI